MPWKAGVGTGVGFAVGGVGNGVGEDVVEKREKMEALFEGNRERRKTTAKLS